MEMLLKPMVPCCCMMLIWIIVGLAIMASRLQREEEEQAETGVVWPYAFEDGEPTH